ncbi:hypothetical protein GCM10023226_05880 [Nocardioides nanhaiensis]|uniref:Asp23/Gls24 family envelope stress response protein n=1 Tax=Nocardioides nanhaiensis TaxID=1476871 RepID=A0ABP8VW17_9ACTN
MTPVPPIDGVDREPAPARGGGLAGAQGAPADPQTEPAVREEHDDVSDRVLAAVLAVPEVRDVHAGVVGEVATYLPGRRVNGVRVSEEGDAEVHVVLEFGSSIQEATDRVRAAARGVVGGRVDVTVEDVAAPS